jgi:hypothetical protein
MTPNAGAGYELPPLGLLDSPEPVAFPAGDKNAHRVVATYAGAK